MKIDVKKFNMIEEAQLQIDGLTVIAGDNDTGKSTIGKLLFSMFSSYDRYIEENRPLAEVFKEMVSLVFSRYDLSKVEMKLTNGQGFCHIHHSERGLQMTGDFNRLPIVNVIYIESPIVWMLTSLFSKYGMTEDLRDLYLLYDVYTKLTTSFPEQSSPQFKESLLASIRKIIGGSVTYDANQFSFIREKDQKRFPITGVASGIQNFAILDVLTRNDHIQPGTVLIIDEPEVHLHPQWEYDYAKLITDYVKLGVRVVITTHSLYMVKALKEFAREIPEKVNYYLTNKNENNYVHYENVTLETYKIFKKFSDPLQSLVWRKI